MESKTIMTQKNRDAKFHELFYDLKNHSAFAGSHIFERESSKLNRGGKSNLAWLIRQDAYNLHKPLRKNFPRRPYNVSNINDLWEVDLMDMRSLKHDNNNYTFILVTIDVLSKFAFAEPVKTKSAQDVTEAFDTILKRSNGCLPITLQSDKGKEFVNKTFKEYLEKQHVIFRLVRDPDVKAACVERFIRTLKTRLWRYFTHTRSKRYIDVLQKFVDSYNSTVHSSIGMKPACVNPYNLNVVKKNLQTRHRGKTNRKPKYSIGTFVRISRVPNVFRKGYERGWSNEIFKIARISTTRQPPVYFLTDLNAELIDCFYYEEELNPVGESDLFEIEKIIKKRTEKNGKTNCLVRWKGYTSDFDSWIPAESIQTLAS